jgi:hypothetical protein
MDEPKRHHYVPQWYLRRFANRREQIRVYHRGNGAYFTTSVENAAVQTGFYTIKEASGRESQVVEKVLGDIDGKADKVASRMITGRFPPGFAGSRTVRIVNCAAVRAHTLSAAWLRSDGRCRGEGAHCRLDG